MASETCSEATDHCDGRKSGLTFSDNRKGEGRGCCQKEEGIWRGGGRQRKGTNRVIDVSIDRYGNIENEHLTQTGELKKPARRN